MKEWQVFHKFYWFKVGRSLDYMMVPFSGGGCNTLKGVPQAIKNLSIGVAYGLLYTLVWIFKYVTDWLFAGLKGANFWYVKKFNNFFDASNFGILSHKLAQICINMWIYGAFFFFASSVRAMTIRVFWQKINHSFTAWRVNNCNRMSFGNL